MTLQYLFTVFNQEYTKSGIEVTLHVKRKKLQLQLFTPESENISYPLVEVILPST